MSASLRSMGAMLLAVILAHHVGGQEVDLTGRWWDRIFKSYDTIAAYAKCRYDTKLTEASCDPRTGRIRLRVAGASPLPLSVYVFAKGGLEYRFQEIPPFQGERSVDVAP